MLCVDFESVLESYFKCFVQFLVWNKVFKIFIFIVYLCYLVVFVWGVMFFR